MRQEIIRFVRLACLMTTMCVVAGSASLFAQDTCPEAAADGITPADQQIQACLDRSSHVTLGQGRYLITSTIYPFRYFSSGAQFSSIPGQTAVLVAWTGLVGTVVHAGNSGGFSLHDFHIDGSLDQGRRCEGSQGYNLSVEGNGWSVYNMESFNSPCANMVVAGDGFSVSNVYLWHSGTSHCGPGCGGPVGDGLDVEPGVGGEIAEITVADATDIGIVVGGGSRWIHDARIYNTGHRGWAGFNVGNFNESGNHAGAVYENIIVTSGYNLLNMGLLLGAHPWSTDPIYNVVNAGTFRNNSSTGAMINMVVEGIAGADSMSGNTTSNHQGGEYAAPGCSGYEYTAWHFGAAPIQPGALGLQYDLGVYGQPCLPGGRRRPRPRRAGDNNAGHAPQQLVATEAER
jgi:hypothetical protein